MCKYIIPAKWKSLWWRETHISRSRDFLYPLQYAMYFPECISHYKKQRGCKGEDPLVQWQAHSQRIRYPKRLNLMFPLHHSCIQYCRQLERHLISPFQVLFVIQSDKVTLKDCKSCIEKDIWGAIVKFIQSRPPLARLTCLHLSPNKNLDQESYSDSVQAWKHLLIVWSSC